MHKQKQLNIISVDSNATLTQMQHAYKHSKKRLVQQRLTNVLPGWIWIEPRVHLQAVGLLFPILEAVGLLQAVGLSFSILEAEDLVSSFLRHSLNIKTYAHNSWEGTQCK
jgi:hypothetical protein